MGSALYPFLSTSLILIVIFAYYFRKIDTDHFQRKIYFSVIFSILIAIAADYLLKKLEGRPGEAVRYTMLIGYTVFFVFQQCAYLLIVVFLDYIINKNSSRTKTFIKIVIGIVAAYVIAMIFNIIYGFYFFISPDNFYSPGKYFLVRFYTGYAAIIVGIIDVFLSSRQLRSTQLYLTIIFASLCGCGAVLNIVFEGGNIIWAFIAAALLCGYFYILHSDTTHDAATGIGNMSSFTEFINIASRQGGKQSFAMAMFDVNDLKKVNNVGGTQAGDKMLFDFARMLKKCSRQSDFIARIGGDEFIIAIKAKFNIEILLARILKRLEEYNQNPDQPYRLSVAYGYDTFTTGSDQTIEDFLQHLNERIYQHKKEQLSEVAVIRREADA